MSPFSFLKGKTNELNVKYLRKAKEIFNVGH
jgi:hypothetical protein